LNEAQDYKQMFQSVVNAYESVPFDLPQFERFLTGSNLVDTINKEIEFVRKTYKKQDRIVWRLRMMKYLLMNLLTIELEAGMSGDVSDEKKQFSQNLINRLDKQKENIRKRFPYVSTSSTNSLPSSNRGIDRDIRHFLGLGLESIENYQWEYQTVDEIIGELKRLENIWQENIKRIVQTQEDDYEILKIDDKHSWWMLDREYCTREGGAMGHCGNEPDHKPGDRILSFRKNISETEAIPYLTFVLHRDGFLGEMKGLKNSKPEPEHHPAIVQLLVKRQNLIKGIRGDGHAPEYNFKLRDLEDEGLQKKLLEMNPKLGTLGDVMSIYGWHSDESKEIVTDLLQETGMKYHEDAKEFILETYSSLSGILGTLNNDIAVTVAESIEGNRDLNFYHGYDLDQSEAEYEFGDFFENNPEEKQRLVDYLKREHDYDEEQDLFDFIYEEWIDDVKRAFNVAYSEGSALGAENQMYKDFKQMVGNLPYFGYEGDRLFDSEKYYKVIGIDEIMDILYDRSDIVDNLEDPNYPYDDGGDYIREALEEYINDEMDAELKNFDEPHYGWQGFDEEVAFDRLKDELYELAYEKEQANETV
jgi:hypothetical protein